MHQPPISASGESVMLSIPDRPIDGGGYGLEPRSRLPDFVERDNEGWVSAVSFNDLGNGSDVNRPPHPLEILWWGVLRTLMPRR